MKLRTILILPSIVAAAAVAAKSAVAEVTANPGGYSPFNHGHDMMMGNSQWGGFGMALGPIVMILMVVGIVAEIVYLLRHFGAAGYGGNHLAHDRALRLLKE